MKGQGEGEREGKKKVTVDYDEFQTDVRRRERERRIVTASSEPSGRLPGRRPRDPEKERILLKMDRARLQREGLVPLGPNADP